MDPQTPHLLCDPETHVPLELANGGLINPESGRRYPIRDGIPVFLEDVTGPNRKYQTMYDRLAPGYDIAERLYRWVSRKPGYRLEYLRELEIPTGARVLEVSVGTGANLRYLRTDIVSSSVSICPGACCADAATTWSAGNATRNCSTVKPSGCRSGMRCLIAFFTSAASTSSMTRRAPSGR
jgi:uncharacterized protein YbaR (Trm112 family)